MKKLILITVIALSYSGQASAQFGQYADYFPLEVGNVWVYRTTFQFYPPTERKVEVTKDTIINSHRYFFLKNVYGINWARFDTTTGNIFLFAPSNGCSRYPNNLIHDSLPASVGDQVTSCLEWFTVSMCLDTNEVSIFGLNNLPSKQFRLDGLTMGMRTYTKGLGITYSCGGEPPPCQSFTTLKGCVINGVLHGDTLMTNLYNITETIPEEFSLHQNYPNPFNPSTKIKFSLPSAQFTKLKVYNLLGQEMSTLVNQQLQPGSYEYTFDASGLSSGVYFYRMESGEYVQTKKFVLLK